MATVIAVMIAWGSHFMWFTRLWFDFAPFYNKFRTVSMALVVLQVTLPLLGFYVLDRIIKEQYDRKTFMKAGYISFAVTSGFCLLCILIPGIAGSFVSASDHQLGELLSETLAADRQAIMVKDAIRSLVMITVTFALLVWAYQTPKHDAVGKDGSFVRKGRMTIVAFAMILVVCFDLIPVGKRYLNKDHFITPKDFSAQYSPRPVDKFILEDPALDYRVLDISVNTFNSSIPSYHHKTIGGYSPVKLQRYQDLIERYLMSEIRDIYDVVEGAETVQQIADSLPELKVTSMLNGKYIILGGEYPPVVNDNAYGNAWYVSEFVPAGNPDEEIALLASSDLRSSAVIGDDFKWAQESFPEAEGDDSIVLSHYAPNELRYSFRNENSRAAIFSEIFYPKGWKAWVEPAGSYGKVDGGHYKPTAEGREIELFRADWMLRGAIIPAGEGEIIMRFEPDSYQLGENISRACSIILILLLLGSVAAEIIARRRA